MIREGNVGQGSRRQCKGKNYRQGNYIKRIVEEKGGQRRRKEGKGRRRERWTEDERKEDKRRNKKHIHMRGTW